MKLSPKCFWCGAQTLKTTSTLTETLRVYTCGTHARKALKEPVVYERRCK